MNVSFSQPAVDCFPIIVFNKIKTIVTYEKRCISYYEEGRNISLFAIFQRKWILEMMVIFIARVRIPLVLSKED